MQTPAKATQARKPKAPAIPALMPLPNYNANSGIFWAVAALNKDACVQALHAVQTPLYNQTGIDNTTRTAISSALFRAEQDANEAFEDCRNAGGLLFAWRGSRALATALPAGLAQGGAA